MRKDHAKGLPLGVRQSVSVGDKEESEMPMGYRISLAVCAFKKDNGSWP